MLLQRILARKMSAGSWCQIGHPASAEILAAAGFEWVAGDCEHGEFEDSDIGNFCRAVEGAGAAPLIRVRKNDPLAIRRALDLGAIGIIVPLVNSVVEAEAAVSAANYPPNGIRGFAWQRGNKWGLNFERYADEFRPIVIAMIESRSAVDAIDSIMAVDGVHAALVGPYDMSGSYGVPGQTTHELVREGCRRVVAACRRRDKAAGQHIVTPSRQDVTRAIEEGFTVLALGMDTYFLSSGARKAMEMLE